MNVNLWGPSFWIVLHGLAKLYDEDYHYSKDLSPDPNLLVKDLSKLLPCPICANHFAEIYASMERPIKGTFSFWMYRAHTLVLQKQWEGTVEKLQDKLGVDPKSLPFDLFVKHPDYSVVTKKLAFHYNDLIPVRDFATVLVCLFRIHDPLTIQHYVNPWLKEIQYFGFQSILSDILTSESPYSVAKVYKYGKDTKEIDDLIDSVLL